jgi:hypothetical protein
MGGKQTVETLDQCCAVFCRVCSQWPCMAAVTIAIGSAMVLFARPDPELTQEQLDTAHPLVRFLAKRASRSSEIRSGWFMIRVGVLIAALRIIR